MDSSSTPRENAEAVTLMSTDADSLDGIGQMLLETCAYTIEVAVGFVLLSQEVGWIWPLPLVLIMCRHPWLPKLLAAVQLPNINMQLQSAPA